MNPIQSTNVRRHVESRSAEKQRRRCEWQRQQELERLNGSTSGTVPLFRSPEGIQISTTELRRIKVDIRRNIPTKGAIPELQRNIYEAEDIVLKRREGEGSKPILDREEIKNAAKINEVKERRTVVAVDEKQSVSTSKLQIFKEHFSSCSTYSSRYFTNSKHQNKDRIRTEFRDHHKNIGKSSIEKYREYKEKYTERNIHKYNTNRSRERDSRKSHSRALIEKRSYRYLDRSDRYLDKSNEEKRNRDRGRGRDRDRDRGREPMDMDVASHYIEPPIHVPIYYGTGQTIVYLDRAFAFI